MHSAKIIWIGLMVTLLLGALTTMQQNAQQWTEQWTIDQQTQVAQGKAFENKINEGQLNSGATTQFNIVEAIVNIPQYANFMLIIAGNGFIGIPLNALRPGNALWEGIGYLFILFIQGMMYFNMVMMLYDKWKGNKSE